MSARAYYTPATDHITMPERALFRPTPTSTATEGYYGVLLQEVGHAVGATHRPARELSGRFGSQGYAMAECVAEWFAAMACVETFLHTDDIGRALGRTWNPPPDICCRALARLFPGAPTDHDPWLTLRWATGRGSLPGYEPTGPTWTWHSAPLNEATGQT